MSGLPELQVLEVEAAIGLHDVVKNALALVCRNVLAVCQHELHFGQCLFANTAWVGEHGIEQIDDLYPHAVILRARYCKIKAFSGLRPPRDTTC